MLNPPNPLPGIGHTPRYYRVSDLARLLNVARSRMSRLLDRFGMTPVAVLGKWNLYAHEDATRLHDYFTAVNEVPK